MESVEQSLPGWAIRHSLEGKKLEENRKYNSNRNIHGEWIHPDRFRYYHKIGGQRFSCGTKYNPDDTSNCPICLGHQYQRDEQEVLKAANVLFSYPREYDIEFVKVVWKKGQTLP